MADSKDDPTPRPPARPAVPPFRGPSGTPHTPLRPVTPSERAGRPPFMPPPMAGKRPPTPAGGRPTAPPAVPPIASTPPVVPAARPVVAPLPPVMLPPMAAAPLPPATPAFVAPILPPPLPMEFVRPPTARTGADALPSIGEFVADEPMDPHELPEPTWDDADHVFSERVEMEDGSDDRAPVSDVEPPPLDTPSGDEGIETYDDALGFGDSAYDVSLPAEAALQDTSTYPTAGLDLTAFANEPEDQASELLASAGLSDVASDALTEWEPRSSGGYPTGEAEIYAPEPPAAWESSAHLSSAPPTPGRGAAEALEAVAGQIRRGELILDETDVESDETTALAAVLLALIRQRR